MKADPILEIGRCYMRAAVNRMLRQSDPARWAPFHVRPVRSRRGLQIVELRLRKERAS